MKTFWIAFMAGCLLGAFIPGVEGYYMAKYHRNRNPWLWFVNCYILGLFTLLMLICSPTLSKDEELDFQEIDTLGYTMLCISVVLMIVISLFVWKFLSVNHFI